MIRSFTSISISLYFWLLVNLHCSDITHVAASLTSEDHSIALIIIDVQNCFVSGTLAVPNGNDVIPVINRIIEEYGDKYSSVIVTKDWHCADHVSFASQHPGKVSYSTTELTYITKTGELCMGSDGPVGNYTVNCTDIASKDQTIITQTLWPDHCVMYTQDAEIVPALKFNHPNVNDIYKGYHCQIDSYSAFYDNGHITNTSLNSLLQQLGIKEVHLTGLATDFCVYYTAKDALGLGYNTSVIVDATRGISPNSTQAALQDMTSLGIQLINSTDLSDVLPSSAAQLTPYLKMLLGLTTVLTLTKT